MSLQGPIVIVADRPAGALVAVLQDAGAFPVVETGWCEAADAASAIEPSAVVVADPEPPVDVRHADLLAGRLKDAQGPFVPVIARVHADSTPPLEMALPISADVPIERLVSRLRSALRRRTLHATVLRRAAMLGGGGATAALPGTADAPLSDSAVLLLGRGRSYPDLSVALGERVGLLGALSVEGAARYLAARDIDGVVIADGFALEVVESLLTVLAENLRFQDLPVAVLGSKHAAIDEFACRLPNFQHIEGNAALLVARVLPFVRLQAFERRLRRVLMSLNAKGMIDADTGLLGTDAFWRDLARAVDDAEYRGAALSVACFSFGGGADRRTGTDAARLVSRLVRSVDFACRAADNSIFAVFTETDLRAAHVIARRIASVLRHTMLAADRRAGGVDTEVTIAALGAAETAQSLIARVTGNDAVAVR
jgi:hypothetical protein